jgi:hypothetical protein
MKFVQVSLACGIPLNKANTPLRIYIEGITQMPLDSAQKLKPVYVKKLLRIEENKQIEELKEHNVGLVADETPRMGDVFAMILRFVQVKDGKASVQKCLINLNFIKGSLNAATQCGAINSGLQDV